MSGEPWRVETYAGKQSLVDTQNRERIKLAGGTTQAVELVVERVNALSGVRINGEALGAVRELVEAASEFLQYWEIGELKNRDVRRLGHWLERFELEDES